MKRWMVILILAGLLLIALGAPVALAQSGFDLSWWTVDGGGAANLSQGGFSLSGTAGQPDAAALQGGGYTLSGGFWPAVSVSVTTTKTFLPMTFK